MCTSSLLSKPHLDMGHKSKAFSVGTNLVSSVATYLVFKFSHFHPVILSANQLTLSHSFIHPSNKYSQSIYDSTCWDMCFKADPWFPRWGTKATGASGSHGILLGIQICWGSISDLLNYNLWGGCPQRLRVLTSPPGGSDAHQRLEDCWCGPRPHSLSEPCLILLEKSRK